MGELRGVTQRRRRGERRACRRQTPKKLFKCYLANPINLIVLPNGTKRFAVDAHNNRASGEGDDWIALSLVLPRGYIWHEFFGAEALGPFLRNFFPHRRLPAIGVIAETLSVHWRLRTSAPYLASPSTSISGGSTLRRTSSADAVMRAWSAPPLACFQSQQWPCIDPSESTVAACRVV